MRFLLLLLVGCGPIDIVNETTPCEDVEFDGETILDVKQDGEDVLVFRTPVFVGDQDAFAPELTFDGATIFVREGWQEAEDSENEVCRSPTVRLISPPSREFAVEWYLNDGVIPDFRVVFQPGKLD